ncbi:MAG TPA: DUF2510 domain-containing protein [Streptosporangiaceae bacterium]|jgi:hypothetical protein
MFFLLFSRGKRGWPQFWYGLVIFCVGLVITAVTYSMASGRSGGTYVVSWGPMIIGVISMVRGLASVSGAKRAQAGSLGNGPRPYRVGQRPHGTAQRPHSSSQRPYGTAQRPYGTGPQQPYGIGPQQPYGAGQAQPWAYAPPPAPLPQSDGMPSAAGTPEGWYPDPVTTGGERWWDGGAWSPAARPAGAP